MKNKNYFTLKTLGEAFAYLASMYDDTTIQEFFQEVGEFTSEHLQEIIQEELSRWYRENRVITTPEDVEIINYRSGVRKVRLWLPIFLEIPVFLPKFRHKQFKSDFLTELFGYVDTFLVALIYSLYVSGISYRKVSDILKLLGYKISPSGVSKKLKKLQDFLDGYWRRDLSNKDFKYLIADGLWIKEKRSVKGKHVVFAVGITSSGEREIIGKQIASRESSSCWEKLFVDLTKRGLDMEKIKLIVGDKSKGLRKYLSEAYSDKPMVRCGFHFGVNVLGKVKDPFSKREMFSDLFWILSKKNVSPRPILCFMT